MKRLPFLAALCLTCVWAFGQVVRDRTLAGQLAFYLPSPAVAAVLAGLALLRLAYGRRRQAAVLALLALAPLAWVVSVENRWAPSVAALPWVTPSGERNVASSA